MPPMQHTFAEVAVAFDPDESEGGGISDAFDIGLGYVREMHCATGSPM